MIKSFKHKGLEKFFTTGSKAGIQPAHASKIEDLLTALNAATDVQDMNPPAWHLHQLTGSLAGHWSVKVNGNWRITFTFTGENAEIVDYQDYH